VGIVEGWREKKGGLLWKPSALKIYDSCQGALFVVGAAGAAGARQQQEQEIAMAIKYNQFDCLLFFCVLEI